MVNSFEEGELHEIATNKEVNRDYPIVWAEIAPSTSPNKEAVYTINLYCFDQVDKQEGNELEVKSDTAKVLHDIRSTLSQEQSLFFFGDRVTTTPFEDTTPEVLAGWRFVMEFRVPSDNNNCMIP